MKKSTKIDPWSESTNYRIVIIMTFVVLFVSMGAWAVASRQNPNRQDRPRNTAAQASQTNIKGSLADHGITPLSTAEASNKQSTADELAYLIEEEKLAHDVYQAMSDRWGLRVFDNIKNSETTHQSLVWSVMQNRGLPDPRTAQAGTFHNQDLQNLYDRLIAQGKQSQTEAYKAGVTIEETDIADLKETLANLDPQDTDVKAVLENLLNGSENHLRAFSRQVNR